MASGLWFTSSGLFRFFCYFYCYFFFLSNGKSDFVASFRYLYEYLPNQVAEVRHDAPESVIMGTSGTEASNNYFSGLYKGQKTTILDRETVVQRGLSWA
jgi:hypothetical protein